MPSNAVVNEALRRTAICRSPAPSSSATDLTKTGRSKPTIADLLAQMNLTVPRDPRLA